jgi:hypothetical protein
MSTYDEVRSFAKCCAQLHLERIARGADRFDVVGVDEDAIVYAYTAGNDDPIVGSFEPAMPLNEADCRYLERTFMRKHGPSFA